MVWKHPSVTLVTKSNHCYLENDARATAGRFCVLKVAYAAVQYVLEPLDDRVEIWPPLGGGVPTPLKNVGQGLGDAREGGAGVLE